MAAVPSFTCNMNYSTILMFWAFIVFNSEFVHQLCITGQNFLAVYQCLNSHAGNFFYVFKLYFVAAFVVVGSLERSRNWVSREHFCVGCKSQQFSFCNSRVGCVNMRNNKVSFCKGSGFVEYGSLCTAKCFKVNASFNKDSLAGSGCYSSTERKRNRNYDCTRAAYNQEHKGSVNPGAPACLPAPVACCKSYYKTWDNCQGKG